MTTPAPRVMLSTDTGAPVLNNAIGSMINLLNACLVNGYGSTPPLGWTKPYASGNRGAYRNNPIGGSGFYLYVDDLLINSCHGMIYEDMVNIDTRIGPASTTAVTSNFIFKTAAVTAVKWIIIGDSYGFYLFVSNINGGGRYSIHYFGDIVPIYPDMDKLTLACYSISSSYGIYFYLNALTSTNPLTYLLRGYPSIFGGKDAGFHAAGIGIGILGDAVLNLNPNGVIQYSPLMVHASVAGRTVGRLPGAFSPFIPSTFLPSNNTIYTYVDGSNTFYLLPGLSYASSATFLFKISEGFRDLI